MQNKFLVILVITMPIKIQSYFWQGDFMLLTLGSYNIITHICMDITFDRPMHISLLCQKCNHNQSMKPFRLVKLFNFTIIGNLEVWDALYLII